MQGFQGGGSHHGKLVLFIKEANLKRDCDFFTKMDPYVNIRIGSHHRKTNIKYEGGKHPKWHEVSFHFQPFISYSFRLFNLRYKESKKFILR